MDKKKSSANLRVVDATKQKENVEEASTDSAKKPKSGLRPPGELNVDGAKIWVRAAKRLSDAGYSIDDYSENLLLMAYAWQRLMKKIKAEREVRSGEVKSMNALLHAYGLCPVKRGGSLKEFPQKRNRREKVNRLEALRDMAGEED